MHIYIDRSRYARKIAYHSPRIPNSKFANEMKSTKPNPKTSTWCAHQRCVPAIFAISLSPIPPPAAASPAVKTRSKSSGFVTAFGSKDSPVSGSIL